MSFRLKDTFITKKERQMKTNKRNRKLEKPLFFGISLIVLSLITGCGSIVTKKTPPFSHIHVGHALTGWVTTPGKKGLIETAKKEAQAALNSALQASRSSSLAQKKTHIANALHAVDPKAQANGSGLGFGLTRALTESIAHLQFAAESDDASANIKRTVPVIARKAQNLAKLSNQLKIFGQAATSATSMGEMSALESEFLSSIKKINNGPYNIKKFRADIQNMASKENPKYTTVDSHFLFNLIRLKSGKWTFRSTKDSSPDDSVSY